MQMLVMVLVNLQLLILLLLRRQPLQVLLQLQVTSLPLQTHLQVQHHTLGILGSSATAPAHAYAANGTYTVVLTAINGNCTSTTSFEISIEVSLEETNQIQFEVYPNPASEQVLVAFENNSNGILNILDATGRLVYTQTFNEVGSVLLPVNVSMLSSGSYTLQLINAEQVGVKRLLIRK